MFKVRSIALAAALFGLHSARTSDAAGPCYPAYSLGGSYARDDKVSAAVTDETPTGGSKPVGGNTVTKKYNFICIEPDFCSRDGHGPTDAPGGSTWSKEDAECSAYAPHLRPGIWQNAWTKDDTHPPGNGNLGGRPQIPPGNGTTYGTPTYTAPPGNGNQFSPPGSDDVRSPCPALNTLANHGFINRNGKAIDIEDLKQAGEDVFSLSLAFIQALINANTRTGLTFHGELNDKGGAVSGNFDLNALFNHSIGADHDLSLFHNDQFFEENAVFDETRYSQFIQNLDPGATEATMEQIIDFQIEEITESCAENPEFLKTANANLINAAAGEKIAFFVLQSAAPLAADIKELGKDLKVDLKSMKEILQYNRLPQDFESLKDRALREGKEFEPLGPIQTLTSPTFRYASGRMCDLNINGALNNCLKEDRDFTRSVTIKGNTFGFVEGCGCDKLDDNPICKRDIVSPKECTSSLNVHETFIPKFNTAGEIKIGGLCFEVQDDKSIYAKPCISSNPDQHWVYDGTRIRSAGDPTKCIMGQGQDQLIWLHNCGSDESAIDDERFTFVTQSNGHTSLDTHYDRCLYKDSSGEGVLLSGKYDSRCWDGRDPSWNKITFTEGLPTAGFKLQTANDDVTPLTDMTFNKCLSGSTTSKKIYPLGNCGSSSWLLSLDPSDDNDKSFKLKFVADNDVTKDLWLALNGDDEYYLEVGRSYAAQFDIGNNFYNQYPGSGTNLSDYHLKVWDHTGYCLGWKREIA